MAPAILFGNASFQSQTGAYGHWINQRLTAILAAAAFFLAFLLLFVTANTLPSIGLALILGVLILIFATLIIRHIIDGIENVILDYVHNGRIILLGGVFLKCVGALCIKYVWLGYSSLFFLTLLA